jgi:hypothetical protein
MQDAFLVKFDTAGTRLWGTYYGGASGIDGAQSCAIDPNGNVYMSGFTGSSSAIASGGHQNTYGGQDDAFLVKFDTAGTRLWATYYGGTAADYSYSCAVDPNGYVYLSGQTFSSSAIASGGFQNTFGGAGDGFLVQFDAAGTRLWGTYYGGLGDDYAEACAVDPGGSVYLAGIALSPSDIASGGHQNTIGGLDDAFLVKFDGDISTSIVDAPSATTTAIPNPTNGLLTITTSRTGQRYAITDAAGRRVLEGVILTNTIQVDLSSERAGVYLLKVWDRERSEVIRIVLVIHY